VDDLHYYTRRESSVREAEEHRSLVKNLKIKKSKWVLKKAIQAQPTSQHARKSNPNRIFT